MVPKSKYPSIPYGNRLSSLERDSGPEIPGNLNHDAIRRELSAIINDRASNEDTRRIASQIEGKLIGAVEVAANVTSTSGSLQYTQQDRYSKEDLLRLARSIHVTHEHVFPGIYTELGMQEARSHTQSMIDAIEGERFLEAGRISHHYAQRYNEWRIADNSELPNREQVFVHEDRFRTLKLAITSFNGVDTYVFRTQPHSQIEIQLDRDTSIADVAHAVDTSFGYYSQGTWDIGGGNKCNLILDVHGGAFLATVEDCGNRKYNVTLHQTPTFDVGIDGLIKTLQSAAK